MAAMAEEYLCGDDLDAVLALIEEDSLTNSNSFSEEVDQTVSEIPEEVVRPTFRCISCSKVCLSKAGLTRHTKTKHKETAVPTSASQLDKKPTHVILHPLVLKKFIVGCAQKLAADECYPTNITDEFRKFTITTLDDVQPCYELIKHEVDNFDGDAEKFYPKIYNLFASAKESPFSSLSHHSSLLLGFELANHVLAHLAGGKVQGEIVEFEHSKVEFTERQKSLISYLSGYVVGTLYRRIRFSKKEKQLYHQKCLSFLQAFKFCDNETDTSHLQVTNVKDRGGLWKVSADTNAIFSTAESYFLSATKNFTKKIDCDAIVSAMMKDPWILANFSKIRRMSSEEIEKEIALNLLGDMLTLYIRVRSHSFAKNQQQVHKMEKKKSKSRSLRTEIKKSTSSLDLGH